MCSAKHLPGYVNFHDKYKEKGIDHIICISVNDPFVMNAWGKENNVGDKIIMMGDPFLNFTKDIGADVDKSGRGLGICLLYTSPSPRDVEESRMPSSA